MLVCTPALLKTAWGRPSPMEDCPYFVSTPVGVGGSGDTNVAYGQLSLVDCGSYFVNTPVCVWGGGGWS